MAAVKSTENTKPVTTPVKPPRSGGVVRPMYGVFIRDQVGSLRSGIQTTLDSVKKNIAKGKPNAKAVANDGVLQGAELKQAKAAAKDLQAAIDALKPVMSGLPAATGGGTTKPPMRFIPMYGVTLRDDLSKFRSSINANLSTIEASIAGGNLTKQATTEAKKAVKALNKALNDLAFTGTNW